MAIILSSLRPIQFLFFFTGRFLGKFAVKWLLKIRNTLERHGHTAVVMLGG